MAKTGSSQKCGEIQNLAALEIEQLIFVRGVLIEELLLDGAFSGPFTLVESPLEWEGGWLMIKES